MRFKFLAFVAVVFIGVCGTAPVHAQTFNPSDFLSLQSQFPSATGAYTVSTSATPTIIGPGGTSLTGVISNGAAVFTFDNISIGNGTSITATGNRPFVFLSKSNFMLSGLIDVSGNGGVDTGAFGLGGAGGGDGGAGGAGGPTGTFGLDGSGLGGGVGGPTDTFGGTGGSGGGYGGMGGSSFSTAGGNPPSGNTYGTLPTQLQGGSGGGGGGYPGGGVRNYAGGGGGGGGAIEIVSLGQFSALGGSILANGGAGGNSSDNLTFGGGGGSGGAIYVRANAVAFSSSILDANGGFGGADGGGGGGGRVLVEYGLGGLSNSNSIVQADGAGVANSSAPAFNGKNGVVSITQVSMAAAAPEPASIGLLMFGFAGGTSFLKRRTRRYFKHGNNSKPTV